MQLANLPVLTELKHTVEQLFTEIIANELYIGLAFGFVITLVLAYIVRKYILYKKHINDIQRIKEQRSQQIAGFHDTKKSRLEAIQHHYTESLHKSILKQQYAKLALEKSQAPQDKQSYYENITHFLVRQSNQLKSSHTNSIDMLCFLSKELSSLEKQYPNLEGRSWDEAQLDLSNGQTHAADHCLSLVENLAMFKFRIASHAAYLRGRIAHLEYQWQEALTFFQKAHDLEPKQQEYLYWLANLLKLNGDYTQAEVHFVSLLEIRENMLAPDHPELAMIYNNLGWIHQSQQQHNKALLYLQKALNIEEQLLPENDHRLATAYENLALIQQHQQKFNDAEDSLRKVLHIKTHTLAADHPELAKTYHTLATLYKKQNNLEKTEKMLRKAILILDKHPTTNATFLAQLTESLEQLYLPAQKL